MHDAGTTIADVRVAPEALARLIRLVSDGSVSATAAKRILGQMVATGDAPDAVASAEGLLQQSDEAALRQLVGQTMARHPAQVSQYREGKRGVAGFLVGQVMKASQGGANPAVVDRLVRAWLDTTGPSS
jgi:Asp-tRNA(Asn)/Glu-tRNA(Gln) amidotransferase B subunit